jgi:hypothetical protein
MQRLVDRSKLHLNHGGENSATASSDAAHPLPGMRQQSFRLPEDADGFFTTFAPSSASASTASGLRTAVQKRLALYHRHSLTLRRRHHMENRSDVEIVRSKALAAPLANRVTCLPTRNHTTTLSDKEYGSYLALKWGIPTDLDAYDEVCPHCKSEDKMHIEPHHPLGCVSGSTNPRYLTARHHLIRDELAKTLSKIGGAVFKESTPFTDSRVRPDVEWIHNSSHFPSTCPHDTNHFVLDVKVTHPLSATLRKKAMQTLGAAAEGERLKYYRYGVETPCLSSREPPKRNLPAEIGAKLVPFVVETFGGFGRKALEFIALLRALVKQHSVRSQHCSRHSDR